MEYKQPYESLNEFKMNEEELGFSLKGRENDQSNQPCLFHNDIFENAFKNQGKMGLNKSMPEKPSIFFNKQVKDNTDLKIDCSSSVVLPLSKHNSNTRETFAGEHCDGLLDLIDKKNVSVNNSFIDMQELVSPRNNQYPFDQQYEGSLFKCLLKDMANEKKPINEEIKEHNNIQVPLEQSEECNKSVINKDKESENSYNSFTDKAKYKSKLKNFKQLFKLLIKVFTSERIEEEDLDMKREEYEILNCIIFRKFMRKLPVINDNIDKAILMKRLSRTIHLTSHKRPEECNKFIFTRVLRFLKKQMRNRFKLGDEVEDKFYQYYFDEVAKKNNIPLEEYYYPLTRKGKTKETLNVAYFTRIFESNRFVNDLIKYMSENLKEEYEEEIIQKLESILLKWDKKFNFDEITNKKCLEEIKNYFIKNKRCKLPWNIDEVKEAVMRVYRLIEMYGDAEFCIGFEEAKIFD